MRPGLAHACACMLSPSLPPSFQKQGIEGANIYLREDVVAKTNGSGYFQLFNITSGNYTVQVGDYTCVHVY